jgi:hypothetical protein
MMGSHRRTLIALLQRAALALAAVVLFAPTTARADCAAHNLNFSGMKLPFDQAPEASRPAGRSSGSASQAPAPKPCSGPSCHKHDPLPSSPLPAPPPAPSGGEQWGWVSPFSSAFISLGGALFRDDARVHAVRRVADVFHPPRTSLSPI